MKIKTVLLSRSAELILGLIFFAGALNGFAYAIGLRVPFPVNPDSALALALANTKYIFLPQKTVEFISAILLLMGRMRFMALLALTPIIVSILLYHSFDEVNPVIILLILAPYILAVSGHKRSLRLLAKLP